MCAKCLREQKDYGIWSTHLSGLLLCLLDIVVGSRTASKDVHTSIPRTHECHSQCGRDFAHRIKDLKMGDYPWLFRWAHCITRVLRGTQERRKGNVTTEAEIGVMWPQAEECQQPLELEEARTDSPLESPEGISPVGHLNFSPITLILDFWPPEM